MKLPVAQQVGSNFPNPTPGRLHLPANLTILSISKREVVHSSGTNPSPNLRSATVHLHKSLNLFAFNSPTTKVMLKLTFIQRMQQGSCSCIAPCRQKLLQLPTHRKSDLQHWTRCTSTTTQVCIMSLFSSQHDNAQWKRARQGFLIF